MGQWLAERSFGEIACLIVVVGMSVSAVIAALRGKGA